MRGRLVVVALICILSWASPGQASWVLFEQEVDEQVQLDEGLTVVKQPAEDKPIRITIEGHEFLLSAEELFTVVLHILDERGFVVTRKGEGNE